MAAKGVLRYLTDQVYNNNQILIAVLGICSALGVTNRLLYAVVMGLAVTFVTSFSCLLTSIFRKYTPDSVRMIVQLAFISLFTIIVDQFLQAYLYNVSKVLSVFVGLIITNCILMGRTEGMAKNVSPLPAFLDGIGAGIGYSIVLALIGGIREVLGFGQILGFQVIPLSWYATVENPEGYRNLGLMNVPPSAFFLIAVMIWGLHWYKQQYQRT
jgi:Na+-transporting NADH:ubiquinone oxidoreductase subunit D